MGTLEMCHSSVQLTAAVMQVRRVAQYLPFHGLMLCNHLSLLELYECHVHLHITGASYIHEWHSSHHHLNSIGQPLTTPCDRETLYESVATSLHLRTGIIVDGQECISHSLLCQCYTALLIH